MKQRTLIDHFKSHKNDWKELRKCENDFNKYDAKQNELEQSVLSIDITKTYNILLSWGGPSDGFKVDTDQNNELTDIRYWFTYDEIKLQEKETEDLISVYGRVLDSYAVRY